MHQVKRVFVFFLSFIQVRGVPDHFLEKFLKTIIYDISFIFKYNLPQLQYTLSNVFPII